MYASYTLRKRGVSVTFLKRPRPLMFAQRVRFASVLLPDQPLRSISMEEVAKAKGSKAAALGQKKGAKGGKLMALDRVSGCG